MSTRANIILKSDSYNESVIFYRHSDGSPEGTTPTLEKFTDWLKTGKIRSDVMQSAGWLVILGAMEYNAIPKFETKKETLFNKEYNTTILDSIETPENWKSSSYEITNCIHDDIEFLYIIDIDKKSIQIIDVYREKSKVKKYIKKYNV